MNFDLYHLSTLLGLLLVVFLVFAYWQSPLVRKLPSAYFLIFGTFLAFFQPMGKMHPLSVAASLSAAKFVICLALVPLAVTRWPKLYVPALWLVVVDALWSVSDLQGMFIGTTQSTLVAAIFFPWILKDRFLRFVSPLVLYAIVYTQGVASYLVLCVHAFFYLYDSKYYRFALGVLLAGMCGIRMYFPEYKLSAGSRIRDIWGPAFKWWYQQPSFPVRWFGTGPLSYEWISPFISEKPHMWMHSDWLQIYFECGIVGLAMSFLILFDGLWRVRTNPIAISVLVSLAIGMMVYSPMQFFVVWVLILWTVNHGSKCR